jgi:replication factor A1
MAEARADKIGEPVNIENNQGSSQPTPAQAPPAPAPSHSAAPQNSYKSPPPAQPPAQRFNQQQGAIAKADMSGQTNAIESLNPYMNRWTLRARITSKGTVRQWKNDRGEGKLFNIEMCDESGDIRATFFKEAVDKFYDVLQVDKVYLISKGQVKVANKQYSTKQYELTFGADAVFELCDDGAAVPKLKYNFVPIGSIEQTQPNSTIDVVGVVTSVAPVSTITVKKSNSDVQKRDVTLADDSGKQINLTLWDQRVNMVSEDDAGKGAIMSVKNCRVSDFNGRSLSCIQTSHVELNPDIDQSHQLRGWWETGGKNTALSTMSGASGGSRNDPLKSISAIKDENLGNGDKPDYLKVRARIFHVKTDGSMWYQACPADGCNKKVTDQGGGEFYCEKCGKAYTKCNHRYIMSMMVSDATGTQWVSSFNEIGEKILGLSADTLAEKKVQGDDLAIEETVHQALFKLYNFKLRCKVEVYQDTPRVKASCIEAEEINFAQESSALLKMINAAA